MTRWSIASALAFGLLLASLPFSPYLAGLGGIEPHADHAPRHGGQLAMVGEHHIEVVRRRGTVEVFLSDARRRPIDALSGLVVFDGQEQVGLEHGSDRWRAPDRAAAHEVEAIMLLADGTRLAISFDFSLGAGATPGAA